MFGWFFINTVAVSIAVLNLHFCCDLHILVMTMLNHKNVQCLSVDKLAKEIIFDSTEAMRHSLG